MWVSRFFARASDGYVGGVGSTWKDTKGQIVLRRLVPCVAAGAAVGCALLLGQDGLGTSNGAAGVAQRGGVVELLRGLLHAKTEMGLLQRFHFGFEAGHILLAQFSRFHCVFS